MARQDRFSPVMPVLMVSILLLQLVESAVPTEAKTQLFYVCSFARDIALIKTFLIVFFIFFAFVVLWFERK